MKKLKKVLALVLAMAMVLGMTSMSAFAAVPTDGSITVNSPVVGATYSAYKVFDMTTNEDVDAFSYTISSNNPFFNTVLAYANMPASGEDANADGLTLTKITTESNPDKYIVSVTSAFNAQTFGQALQAALTGDPALNADSVKETPITVTDDNSDKIVFDGLDLGYYLITSQYPTVTATASLTLDGVAEADWDATNHWTFTADELKDGKLTDTAMNKINQYVDATVTDEYVENYVNTHTSDFDGKTYNQLTAEEKAKAKNDLKDTTRADAVAKVGNAINKMQGEASDINVKEPILVFLDSSQPEAVINEKNELDKWDIPVNPEGHADMPGVPEHGEPDGGKNIVVKDADPTTNSPAIYGDWSEAKIGDPIHYQLRVNAMNFIRTGNDDTTVQQVKEYFLADFENANMHYDSDKGIKVTVVNGSGTDVTKNPDGTAATNGLDYSAKSDDFFMNDSKVVQTTTPSDVFGTDGKGIMIPWVKVVKNPTAEELDELKESFPVYTTSLVDTGKIDDEEQKIIDTYYVFSLYSSDVTIVVDYYMILDDTAVVDDPGNKNYAQYGWNPVEPKDTEPTPPGDNDKPSKKERVDEATVYTYAIAWVKVNDSADSLAGAKFQLPFYVKTAKDENTYVYGGTDAGNGLTNVVTTDTTGVITIKGLTAGTYSITETEAPKGYNKLAAPFDVEAKKSSESVTTKTETVIYLDADGKITDTQTSTTVTKNTDKDNNVDNVPVYQFDPIVNKQGTELPSTGGIGTTIFYVLGTILVIGAGVVMVTRRRMDA